jgi:putative DNA primase/helicase
MLDSPTLDLAATVARLASLAPLAYDQQRVEEATRLGVRIGTLDTEVQRVRSSAFEHPVSDDARPPEFTDESLALRFTATHQDRLRHIAGWGKWCVWSGSVWRSDDTMLAFDYARTICREASAQCTDDAVAANVAAARTVAGVERLAKADRRHAATVDQWDGDPWLLNTPGGVVDLKTGKMRHHRPDDHMTKITAIAPGGECPLWLTFLAKATGGDAELQAYIKRMCGYALTGSIREHALFFAYGTGANGKGVTINTLTGLMGDYAAVASIETFTASTSDRHPTDLAMLRGARLVTAQETEEGRRWAESRIKAMTGGDPITARFMRQDFFTFAPTFKLLIAGNHRPGLRNVDEAIRRRFNLLPFAVKIAAADRDHDLPEKLKAEWPGILKWAIEGCLEWQRDGLAAPPAVIDATAEYLEAEDATASWMVECCITDGSLHSGSSSLFASWKTWAEAAGEHPGSQKGFSQKLVANGFAAKRMPSGDTAGFLGLGLKPTMSRSGASGRRDDTEDRSDDAPFSDFRRIRRVFRIPPSYARVTAVMQSPSVSSGNGFGPENTVRLGLIPVGLGRNAVEALHRPGTSVGRPSPTPSFCASPPTHRKASP